MNSATLCLFYFKTFFTISNKYFILQFIKILFCKKLFQDEKTNINVYVCTFHVRTEGSII